MSDELLLAQDVQMGHQLLLLNPHLNPYTGGLPPAYRSILQVPQKTGGATHSLRSPQS